MMMTQKTDMRKGRARGSGSSIQFTHTFSLVKPPDLDASFNKILINYRKVFLQSTQLRF